MDIYKALKKESKSIKRFYIIMIVLFIILPLAVYLTGLTSIFYLSYLTFMEFLIFVAVVNKLNYTTIRYSCNNNRLKYKSGIFSKDNLILCDKVALVHTEKMEQEMEIIIVTSVKFRNRGLKLVTDGFLKRYKAIEKEYSKLKKLNPDTLFYYQIIRRGGLKKYLLLDLIYKNCVKAVYTEEGIQNIKIARGQTLV
ncbi:MAG: hypothetical protein PUE01_13645 [Clostridiaceae bacterium]|nr:hypothetical protein [Clostridiaceae bacterium]